MAVIALAEYRNRETISVLKCLLDEARKGHITGLAACFRTNEGEERSAFTDAYRSPASAAAAAMRLSWRLTQIEDAGTDPP